MGGPKNSDFAGAVENAPLLRVLHLFHLLLLLRWRRAILLIIQNAPSFNEFLILFASSLPNRIVEAKICCGKTNQLVASFRWRDNSGYSSLRMTMTTIELNETLNQLFWLW